MISSYVGENYEFERQFFSGELELEICPQGTLAEKIRAGGAGIPAFFTATGVDTIIERGGFHIKYKTDGKGNAVKDERNKPVVEIESQPKLTMIFGGKRYIMERSLFGDFALVKAKRADKMGNLQFEKTERNFNADMATAAKCVIAEVEEIVEDGELDPEAIHIPAVYVDRVYKQDPSSPYSEVYAEKLTIAGETEIKAMQKESDLRAGRISFKKDAVVKSKSSNPTRLKIAKRAAQEVSNGMNVNLGIGIPTLLPSVLPADVKINLQSENGIMGVGSYPTLEQASGKNINAGKVYPSLFRKPSPYSQVDLISPLRSPSPSSAVDIWM